MNSQVPFDWEVERLKVLANLERLLAKTEQRLAEVELQAMISSTPVDTAPHHRLIAQIKARIEVIKKRKPVRTD